MQLQVTQADTNEQQIALFWPSLDAPLDGGSDVLSYNIQWDMGLGNDFYELIGVSVDYT